MSEEMLEHASRQNLVDKNMSWPQNHKDIAKWVLAMDLEINVQSPRSTTMNAVDQPNPNERSAPEALAGTKVPGTEFTETADPAVERREERIFNRNKHFADLLDDLVKNVKDDTDKRTPVNLLKMELQGALIQTVTIDDIVGVAAEAIYRLTSRDELRKALGLNG